MKNYSLSIPKLVEFQGLVQRCFPSSDVVIAGGCLRDLIHDVEVKDIDVFLCLPEGGTDDWLNDEDYQEYEQGTMALRDLLKSTMEVKYSEAATTYGSAECFRIVDYPEGFRMYPVQLIFCDDHPVEMLKKSFDFGLCQVWIDRGKLQMTSEYWRDQNRKAFHYRPESAEEGRITTAERIRKLWAKYPGWEFKGVEKILREAIEKKLEYKPKTGADWAGKVRGSTGLLDAPWASKAICLQGPSQAEACITILNLGI